MMSQQGAAPETFHDETGRLRPEYRWYEEQIYRMSRAITGAVTLGDSLQTRLAEDAAL